MPYSPLNPCGIPWSGLGLPHYSPLQCYQVNVDLPSGSCGTCCWCTASATSWHWTSKEWLASALPPSLPSCIEREGVYNTCLMQEWDTESCCVWWFLKRYSFWSGFKGKQPCIYTPWQQAKYQCFDLPVFAQASAACFLCNTDSMRLSWGLPNTNFPYM